ncbi:MAG: nitroreductase family protein [Acidimicrobiales bacterium]
MDFLLRQRAYRDLLPDPVPDELIEQILRAATHAPSAENLQPWEFVVITDPSLRAEIGRMTADAWEGGGRSYATARLDPAMLRAVERWATGGLATAPVHIVVCGDTTAVAPALLPSSIYPAVQNILLAAISLGLGSLLSTLPVFSGPAFSELLGLPESITPMALIPIGYPARQLGPARRQPVASKIHRDGWDGRWVTT